MPAPRRLLPSARLALALTLLSALGAPALRAQEAIPTRVVVRAVAQDAKIIGSSVGGARITIRDAATGAVLAEGVQEGGTGDTQAIMGDRARGASVFATEGAGVFEATLPLSAPTTVVIEAEGPLGTPHAVQRASATLLLVPGHHVEGDGVVLMLHGFTVELVDLAASGRPGSPIPVHARITMLCGCPTQPGGLWDSDRYTLEVALLREGRVVVSAPLTYAGETSHYSGEIVVPADLAPGGTTIRVVAVDAERANAGMVSRDFRIDP